jgi:lipid II:glycine glycyltransferase (peptidoglycan interpeptide bridge formation enzyme)
MIMTLAGNRATYLYGGTSNQKRQMMAGYALQWHAIRTARELNCSTYDFFGYVAPCRVDHEYARFSRFKAQFGGKPQRFVGAHDIVFVDHLADIIVRAIGEVQND